MSAILYVTSDLFSLSLYSQVVQKPVVNPSGPVTLAELQQVVVRHAAYVRSGQVGMDLLALMQLGPFAFGAS